MFKNVGSNWLLHLTGIGAAFLLMPFTIRMLGDGQYGVWLLLTSITSYLYMLALGVPMATVRFVSKYASVGDQENLDRTIGSCVGMYGLIGIVALIVGGALFFVFRAAYDIPPELSSRVNVAYGLTVVFIAVQFVGQLPYGIMNGHQEFVLRNKIQTLGIVVRLGLTYLLLTLEASLVWLAVVQLCTFTCEFSVAMVMVRRRYPNVHIRLRNFDRGMVRQILSFSLFVLLLQLGAQVAFRTDSLVIGAVLPLSSIPHFSVPSSLALYVIQFVIAIAAVVMAKASELEAKGRLEDLREMVLKWSKLTLSFTLVASLFLIILGPRFIAWWIDPAYEKPAGAVLQILMISNLVYLPARGVALPLLMGMGKPGRATLAYLAASILNLGMSVALVRPFGLNGVALGTAVPNVAFAVYVVWLGCRTLEIPIGHYVEYVVGRTVVGALPVAALLVWLRFFQDVRGFMELFLAGSATLLISGVISVLFVYRNDRYVDLAAWRSQVPFLKRTA